MCNGLPARGAAPCRQTRIPAQPRSRLVRPSRPASPLRTSRPLPAVPLRGSQSCPSSGRQKSASCPDGSPLARPDPFGLSVQPEAVQGRMAGFVVGCLPASEPWRAFVVPPAVSPVLHRPNPESRSSWTRLPACPADTDGRSPVWSWPEGGCFPAHPGKRVSRLRPQARPGCARSSG